MWGRGEFFDRQLAGHGITHTVRSDRGWLSSVLRAFWGERYIRGQTVRQRQTLQVSFPCSLSRARISRFFSPHPPTVFVGVEAVKTTQSTPRLN